MKKHFVRFLSPGTFVSEETTKEIDSWDIDKAVEMSKTILERYDARPYGFYFITRERSDNELDSHESAKSNMYYLGGTIYTLDDMKAIGNPDDRIFIQNMKINGWERCVENNNSWKFIHPLFPGDVVLDIKK